MVGTIFLWICWPSFNACLLSSPANQYRYVCSDMIVIYCYRLSLYRN